MIQSLIKAALNHADNALANGTIGFLNQYTVTADVEFTPNFIIVAVEDVEWFRKPNELYKLKIFFTRGTRGSNLHIDKIVDVNQIPHRTIKTS